MTHPVFDASRTTADLPGPQAAPRDAVDGEVRFDAGSRGACATHGSHCRQVPNGVAGPVPSKPGRRRCGPAHASAPRLSHGGGTGRGHDAAAHVGEHLADTPRTPTRKGLGTCR